jgi:putative transposase
MEQILPLLTVGAQFEMSGCPYEVAGVHRDEVRIAPMKGGTMRHLKFGALSNLLDDKRIEIRYTPPQHSIAEGEQLRSALKPAQLDKLNRQLRWIHGIYREIPQSPCSQQAIANIREDLRKKLCDDQPPGVSTLADWMKQWIRGGRRDEALMPKVRATRVDHRGLDRSVLDVIDHSIEAVYLTRQRNAISAVYADIELAIANHNATSTTKLKMPSYESVRRIVNRLDGYERDLRRYGKQYARRKHRAAGAAIVASEPLELCQADGQIMDLIIVEPERDDGLPQEEIGRPFLTVIIDVRTRCVLAAYVSLAPFCGGTLLKTMATAVVAAPGRPRGIMQKLIVDNGADYRDAAFARFCSQQDITVEPCPPRTPNAKAIVERFFRTLNDDLIHKLPGTTFSNPTRRGDYQSQKLARLTLEELRKTVDTWIHEVYHRRAHRSLGRAPIDVWNDEVIS